VAHLCVGDQVSVRILALHPHAPLWLDATALDRRRAGAGALASLDAVTLTGVTTWSVPLARLGSG
jgi:phage terminase small subunit